MTLFIDALVVGADADDAIAVEQQFRPREAGEYGNPRGFDFAAQPFYKSVERNNVVPMVAQRRRGDRKLKLAFLGEKVDGFFRDLSIERGFFFESWQKLTH